MPRQPSGSDENGNWSSFQLANSAPPLSVTGSAIAPSARMHDYQRRAVSMQASHDRDGCKLNPDCEKNVFNLKKCYPKGFATLGESAMLRRQVRRATGKPRGHRSPRKIDVTGKLTVVCVSVVTLIRTDTTLDHSQKAEKV